MDALAVDSRRFGAWADRDYRVAKAIECFGLQFGVHYPHEERPAGRNLRRSPLHDLMLDRGAVMGFAHGWERPNWFSDRPGDEAEPSFRRANWFPHVAHECRTASEAVALADLSVFSKFRVSGPGTQSFLAALGANRPPKPGRISLTHALTPAGGVASEFTVARLAEDAAYLTSAAAAEEMDLDVLQAAAQGFDVTVENVTEAIAVIGLMGPKSREVLQACCDDPLDFPWLSHREITVADQRCLALRVSYIGELGWELHVAAEHAVPVFLALETAGTMHHLGYYGAYAANAMRLEKGYRGWGADLTTERSPLEAGLEAFVDKSGPDFTGRAAMLERQAGDPWDMVLLELEAGPVDPFYAHAVWQGDRVVGIVTSGAYGHRTGKVLALAYLRDTSAREGLSVSILGQPRKARILDAPPYDPDNLKPRA